MFIESSELTIVLSGDLDLAVRARLQQQFEEAASEARNVTVDLTNVNYLDSSAIGALIVLFRRLHESGGSLRVRLHRNAAYRLLEIAGLTGVFPLEVLD